jgi:hypothetical protein
MLQGRNRKSTVVTAIDFVFAELGTIDFSCAELVLAAVLTDSRYRLP